MHEVEPLFSRDIRFPFCNLVIEATEPIFLARNVLSDNSYDGPSTRTVYLRINLPSAPSMATNYRRTMFSRGLYLGHHLGPPADIEIVGGDVININSPDMTESMCDKIIWTFVVKLVLTLTSLRNGALHLKGVALRKDEEILLLVGRGGSGKTTLSNTLAHFGYQVIANTHCVVKDSYIWGINTWIRTRMHNTSDIYTSPANNVKQEGHLRRICVYEYNASGICEVRPLNRELARAFLTFFSAGIANYDLKEDIVDCATGSFVQRYEMLSTELALIDELVSSVPVNYISCDNSSKNALDELGSLLDNSGEYI